MVGKVFLKFIVFSLVIHMTTVEEFLPHLGLYVKLWYKKCCQASVSKVPQNVGTMGVFKHLSLGPGDLTTQSSVCRCSTSCERPSWRKQQLLLTATWSPNHSCFPCVCRPNPSLLSLERSLWEISGALEVAHCHFSQTNRVSKVKAGSGCAEKC